MSRTSQRNENDESSDGETKTEASPLGCEEQVAPRTERRRIRTGIKAGTGPDER